MLLGLFGDKNAVKAAHSFEIYKEQEAPTCSQVKLSITVTLTGASIIQFNIHLIKSLCLVVLSQLNFVYLVQGVSTLSNFKYTTRLLLLLF